MCSPVGQSLLWDVTFQRPHSRVSRWVLTLPVHTPKSHACRKLGLHASVHLSSPSFRAFPPRTRPLPHPCPLHSPLSVDLERYYQTENEDENPFICSQPRENGMRSCRSVPTLRGEGGGGPPCGLDYESYNSSSNTTCVNWNQYYTNCSAGEHNPFKGAINFDNIGYAWIAIFQVGQPGCREIDSPGQAGAVLLGVGWAQDPWKRLQETLGGPESACPSATSPGYHAGGLGRHHVLCDGCSFLLQLHLLHPPHHRE